MVNIFAFLIFLFFALLLPYLTQVQDVEAINVICQLLTASGNLFWNMSDACQTACKSQFHEHHSYFRNDAVSS